MNDTKSRTPQLEEVLRRARGEPTLPLRDVGVILGRSYNFMLRFVLNLQDRVKAESGSTRGIEIFPGVLAYRLGTAPGSHYIVPFSPLLSALGLPQPAATAAQNL